MAGTCFEISERDALAWISHYEGIAKRASQIAEKLAAEATKAKQEGRPINKGRFAVVVSVFGIGSGICPATESGRDYRLDS